MLSDAERQEIERELERYPDRRALCVEALQVVQRHRGFISDEALRDAAELLGLSVAELDGVATFYNKIYRRPVGRHVLHLCDGVSCWVVDHERLRRGLEERLGVGLGGTTPDGRFTLLPTPCLGACDGAPALMVDDDLHRNVSAGDLPELLDRYAGGEEA